MIDGNENMNTGPLSQSMATLGLAEVIIQRHGGNTSIVLQNDSNFQLMEFVALEGSGLQQVAICHSRPLHHIISIINK
jgi:rhamnose utilization protein RhaD (predicted bifunctional aldolase and dehydrogenase)